MNNNYSHYQERECHYLNKMPLKVLFFFCLLAIGLCGGGGVFAQSIAFNEGIASDKTRIVYDEGQGRVPITLINKTHNSYLVQAWVRGIDVNKGDVKDVASPFFIKSPLIKMSGAGRYAFQIVQIKPVPVQDRESVYLLSFKFIPNQHRDDKLKRIDVVLTYNVKLFYRPKALRAGRVSDAWGGVTFSRQGSDLLIKNPSPYWITFYSLSVDGNDLDGKELRKMLPPKGNQTYHFKNGLHAGDVVSKIIDENGEVSIFHRTF